MQFNLTIELNNDAMQTTGEIIDAVWGSFTRVGYGYTDIPSMLNNAPVFDLNGNIVGKWSVTK